MNEREKMLAEGPRVAPEARMIDVAPEARMIEVAPEPRTVDAYEAMPAPVLADDAAAAGSSHRRIWRLLPLGIPVAFVLANVAGVGDYLGLTVLLLGGAFVLLEVLTDLRK